MRPCYFSEATKGSSSWLAQGCKLGEQVITIFALHVTELSHDTHMPEAVHPAIDVGKGLAEPVGHV